MNEPLAYLNGEYLPLAQARVPVLDRGFLLGDGIYEVLPVFNGKILRMEQHLQRLDASLQAVYMENPLTRPQWQAVMDKVMSDAPEQYLYIQISRGVSPFRTAAIDPGLQPTVLVMSQAMQPVNRDGQGLAAITHEDIRWSCCHIKATTLLACVLLRHKALLAGASEALLLRRGELTEGAASSVFVVADGVIMTPPKSRYVLSGITRDLLLELLDEQGRAWREQPVSAAQLGQAEEICLLSSTWQLQPVVQLDGRPVGTGRTGKQFRYLERLYREFRDRNTRP